MSGWFRRRPDPEPCPPEPRPSVEELRVRLARAERLECDMEAFYLRREIEERERG